MEGELEGTISTLQVSSLKLKKINSVHDRAVMKNWDHIQAGFFPKKFAIKIFLSNPQVWVFLTQARPHKARLIFFFRLAESCLKSVDGGLKVPLAILDIIGQIQIQLNWGTTVAIIPWGPLLCMIRRIWNVISTTCTSCAFSQNGTSSREVYN